MDIDSNMETATPLGPPYSTMAGRVNPLLLRGLSSMGYTNMTPVQHLVLTQLPSFRHDCLVQAKTGTGKTIAFLLPALHSLLQDRSSGKPLPRGQVGILILSPTRELAQQISKECDLVTQHIAPKLECHLAFGGTTRATYLKRFMEGNPSVLVATPGRLKDYLSEKGGAIRARFSNMRVLVLDEADTMLEKGFLADVGEILKLLPRKDTGWQGMCFSATIPAKIRDVINVVLKPGYANISTVEDDGPPTIDRVDQYHIIIPDVTYTYTALLSLLAQETNGQSKVIVFGITANMVALFAKVFDGLLPMNVYEMHSRLSQTIRTRITSQFKAAESGIMFASDVIGRGMDFPNVDLVVQVGLPSNGEQYVHRVGRTARAGLDGRAIIMLTQRESFFLAQNRQLPIKPYPKTAEIVNGSINYAPALEQKMHQMESVVIQRAYSSYLGFFAGSGLMKPLHIDKTGLVSMANELATQAMYQPEPPGMERKTVGKMGLKGVAGLRYVVNNATTQKEGSHQGQGRGIGRGPPLEGNKQASRDLTQPMQGQFRTAQAPRPRQQANNKRQIESDVESKTQRRSRKQILKREIKETGPS